MKCRSDYIESLIDVFRGDSPRIIGFRQIVLPHAGADFCLAFLASIFTYTQKMQKVLGSHAHRRLFSFKEQNFAVLK